MSRRTLLRLPVAVGLAVLTACHGGRSTPVPLPSPPTDPDAPLRRRAVAAEVRLLAAYDAAQLRHPVLRRTLVPLRAEHAAHLAALGGAAPGPSRAPARPAADAGAALRGLIAAERAAALARAGDCLAGSPALAALLASIGASEASHAVLLSTARVPRR